MEKQVPVSLDLEIRNTTTVALLGSDYRGVRFETLCQEGDEVQAGAVVMRDARRTDIRFVAPAAGRITGIERGPRRRLVSLQIEVDPALGVVNHEKPTGDGRSSLREFMFETGVWSSLRTRPFGNIPDLEAEPVAIFISALDGGSQAPDPAAIIDCHIDEFRTALEALTKISSAPLYVCHAPNHTIGFEASDRLHCVAFNKSPRAALPGMHINALCPIGFGGGEVWHLGYQDVISLGCLLLRGSPWQQRVISIAGSAVKNPRCLLVTPGAALDELLADEVIGDATRVLAGCPIHGRPIASSPAYLSAGQRQITVEMLTADESGSDSQFGHPLIPSDRLEQLAPPGIFPVPLMRALQLGDAERARELGALELVEEDVTSLSRACVSGSDYGLLLRNVLDQLEASS